jgi:hypothetical protein
MGSWGEEEAEEEGGVIWPFMPGAVLQKKQVLIQY